VQKLHLVGFTPELDGLILSTRKGAKSGSFVVKVDAAQLRELTEAAKPKPAAARTNGIRPSSAPRATRPESTLAPREMQALLREGWTIEEVAVEAGVDVDWVSRFASPVLAEMRLVLDQARECVFEKPRVGVSALPLAAAVRRNIAEKGVRLTDEDFESGWRAHQLDELTWVVGFDYVSRGRTQHAEWTLDLETGELAHHNRLGSQLAYVQSARRKVETAPPPKPKPKAAAKKAVRLPAPPPERPVKALTTTPPARRARTRAAATPPPKKRATAGTAKPAKPRPSTPEPFLHRSAPPGDADPRKNESSGDAYRDALRRRDADIKPATREPSVDAVVAPAPRPAPVPVREQPEPEFEPLRPVAIIGPTVRTLARRAPRRAAALTPAPAPPPPPRREPAPRREPPPPATDDTGPTPVLASAEALPDLRWAPRGNHGPLPAPDPVPVPETIREKVAAPLGTVEEPEDLPAETWFPKGPTFKGAHAAAPPVTPRRRRSEPLRGR